MTIDKNFERVAKDIINYDEKYDILEELGKGSFGSVSKCKSKETGVLVAAKFIRKTAKSKVEFENEVKVMKKLDHKYLIKLYDAFETRRQLIIVMELVSGQELFQKCAQEEVQLTEYQVARYMRQILEGVNHMHEKNIVHLDLKPENILCSGNIVDADEIKIIDFGFSRELKSEEQNKVICGTAEFIAPEVISFNPITLKTDMWSIGVITYVLLSGISPFLGGNDNETFDNVTIGDYSYNVDDGIFDTISEEAKNFIDCCLKYKACHRMSVEEALNHKWLKKLGGLQLILDNKENLNQFLNRRRWQRIFNTVKAAGRFYSIIKSFTDNQESTDSDRDDNMETEISFDKISNLVKNSFSSGLQISRSLAFQKSDENIVVDDVSPCCNLQEVLATQDESIYFNTSDRYTDSNNNSIGVKREILNCAKNQFGNYENQVEMEAFDKKAMEVDKKIPLEAKITPKTSIEDCFSSSFDSNVKVITKEERILRRSMDKNENFMLSAEPQRKQRAKRLSTSDCESIQEEDENLKTTVKKNKDGGSSEEILNIQIQDKSYPQYQKNDTANITLPNDNVFKSEETSSTICKKGPNNTTRTETTQVLPKSTHYRNLVKLNENKISPENVRNLKISKLDTCKISEVRNDINVKQHSEKFVFSDKKLPFKNGISVTEKKSYTKPNSFLENKCLEKVNSIKETKAQAKGVNISSKIAFFQK